MARRDLETEREDLKKLLEGPNISEMQERIAIRGQIAGLSHQIASIINENTAKIHAPELGHCGGLPADACCIKVNLQLKPAGERQFLPIDCEAVADSGCSYTLLVNDATWDALTRAEYGCLSTQCDETVVTAGGRQLVRSESL